MKEQDQARLNTLSEEMVGLEAEVNDLTNNNAQLTRDLTAAHGEIAELQRSGQMMLSQLEELRGRVAYHQAELERRDQESDKARTIRNRSLADELGEETETSFTFRIWLYFYSKWITFMFFFAEFERQKELREALEVKWTAYNFNFAQIF